MDDISKAPKISSWDELKKTREAIFELEDGRTVKLRGVTEGERRKAVQAATELRFNKATRKDEKLLNEDELGYHLILTGWLEPEIPGATFAQKKDNLDELGYAILQKVALKINKLSGLSREDIDEVKNFLGPA